MSDLMFRRLRSGPDGSPAKARWRGAIELVVVLAGFGTLTSVFTYPLVFNLSTLGYKLGMPGDAQYSVWNVAWVAHALLTTPSRVLDANIFFPHRGALLYSEANLAAGILGVPAMWLTGNAYAAHNSALLLSFILSGAAMYYLVRYLTSDRQAAVIAAIAFAYCPYVFGHLPHIQLLMTAGLPLSLLSFHRVVDRPTLGRGAVLGVSMAGQAIACAYYGVFVVMVVGLGICVTTFTLGFRNRRFWMAIVSAAAVAVGLVAPLLLRYLSLQREMGFTRTLQDAAQFSATWSSYLTSAAYLSSWIHPLLPRWSDVLFPGYLPILLGICGAIVAWRRGGRERYLSLLYALIAGLAFWESFGPRGGLYPLTYSVFPAFSFLRAPSRFGVLVVFSLCVLTGLAVTRLLSIRKRSALLFTALAMWTVSSRLTPIPLTANPEFHPVYAVLASEPPGAVVELPLYSRRANYFRTQYMLASTMHWKPLVNAYSDMIPETFSKDRDALSMFPTDAAFSILERTRVRYAVFHLREYEQKSGLRGTLEEGLEKYAAYLRKVYADDEIWLYEILDYPSEVASVSHFDLLNDSSFHREEEPETTSH